MKTNCLRWILASLLVGAVVLLPGLGTAEEKKMDPPPAERKSSAQRAIPFRGKVTAMDKAAKTVTVGARVFQITSETKILKGDQPGTLDDGVVGASVSGNYQEGGGGKLVAKMIRFGPKAETEDKPAKSPSEGGPKKLEATPKKSG
jgi:hypothetical protein